MEEQNGEDEDSENKEVSLTKILEDVVRSISTLENNIIVLKRYLSIKNKWSNKKLLELVKLEIEMRKFDQTGILQRNTEITQRKDE